MKYCSMGLLMFAFWSQQTMAQPAEDWQLVTEENGVQFLMMHKVSRIDNTVTTVLKIRNNNDYKVCVSFKPEFICSIERDASPSAMKQEKVYLAGKDDSSLFSFQACGPDRNPTLKLPNLLVEKSDE